MDIASGLVFRVAHQSDRFGPQVVLVTLVLVTALALLGAAMMAGLLLSAPDSTTVAPLRWG